MDDVSVDGAVAAATYFLSLFPYVHESGDLTQWKAMSHPECIFCASVATGVEEMHAKGNHQEGGLITIESASGRELDPGISYAIDIDAAQGPATEFDVQGLVADEVRGERLTIAMIVHRDGDRWLIRASEAAVATD
jgi:hypothetical protein